MISLLRNKEYFFHMEVLPQYTRWFLSMTYRFPDYQIGKNAPFLQDRNLGDLREKEICLHLEALQAELSRDTLVVF